MEKGDWFLPFPVKIINSALLLDVAYCNINTPSQSTSVLELNERESLFFMEVDGAHVAVMGSWKMLGEVVSMIV